MARSSLIPRRVKNTGVDLLIAGVLFGGAIIGLQYANKKFGILNKFVQGSASLGSAIGQAVGSGIAGIPSGVGQGALSVFNPTGTQNNAVRAALGLPPDTNGCLTIPFTNIPLPGQNCNKAVNDSQNGLQQTSTSPLNEPVSSATGNTAGGVTVDTNRNNDRSNNTNPSQPGSNLIPAATYSKAVSILQGTSSAVNLATAPTLRTALNNLISGLNTQQAGALTGQTGVVGNYKVPGGSIVPLTQDAVNFYATRGVRITRV